MVNADVTTCYDEDCFRPVGLAWDKKGRLFMSSDQTGEVYVITRTDGSSVNSAGSDNPGSIPKQHQAQSGSGGGNENDGSHLTTVGCVGILSIVLFSVFLT